MGLLYRQFYQYADTNTLRKLYVSLIRPHLEYACSVWDPFSAKDCDILESVQRFASRVCLKNWSCEYPEMLNSLNLPSLATRRKVINLSLMYKIANGLAMFPEAPLSSVHHPYATRYVHNLSFCNIQAHTSRLLYSYFPGTINLWKIACPILLFPPHQLILLNVL